MYFYKKNSIKKFLVFFAIATLLGLGSFAVSVTAELAERFPELTSKDWKFIVHPLIDELTGVYSYFLLIPFILILFKKYPITKQKWFNTISLYLFVSVAIGLTHTLIMYISRSIIYPLFELGYYDYGYIPFRIVMEYLKQFVSFWIVYVVFTIRKISMEKEEEKLRATKLEELLTKARLETLKTQLNPHFLFNTLNMISSTMYEDIQAADKMIANLSDLLRTTLKNSSTGEHLLEKELEVLNLYIQIMRARFGNKLQIDFIIDETTKKSLVPNFIFQPLVENSIKYGMENLTLTKIEISTKKINDRLLIEIKDNGPGIQIDSKEVFKNGVGLSNTVERLEQLYNSDFKFEWENLNSGGLLLTIVIPFKTGDL